MVSSGVSSLDRLLGDGYPAQSAVLVTGPPGIGKEALTYWFTYSGLTQGEYSLYVTRLFTREVIHDMRGYGIDTDKLAPAWLSSDTGPRKYDVDSLSGISENISSLLAENSGRKVRVATDILSQLLMINPPESVYKFLTQLFSTLKQRNAVLLATMDDGMHRPDVLASMQQLFDGVVELRLYEGELRVRPLLRILKMRGSPPSQNYFDFLIPKGGMEVTPYSSELGFRAWLRGPK